MANNLLNVRKVHPDHPERPVIDWDLILQLQPMTIAGALIGADLNEKLPEVVLLVLMLLLLTVTAVTTLRKACKLYRKEEEEKKNGSVLDADDERGNNGQNSAPVKLDLTNDTNGNGNWIIGDIFDAGSPTVKDMSFVNWTYFEMDSGATKQKYGECDNIDESNREAIKRQCTKDAIKLITLFTVVTTLDLLEGTPDGTVFYKIREVLIFGSIVLFSLYVRLSLLKRQEAGGAILSDIRWDERNTIIYPSISIVAGLTAGGYVRDRRGDNQGTIDARSWGASAGGISDVGVHDTVHVEHVHDQLPHIRRSQVRLRNVLPPDGIHVYVGGPDCHVSTVGMVRTEKFVHCILHW
eukprot:CAMPEP_0181139102 /NCGR_PEP_ID=MMETSP1071-20121207/34607_1 /TAXON_ID=35127 /ORGANISM="Thalassiosira sp., Strain NH16" /LENGTH=351 /DNA_ID=CAMNT_0023225995 /DNA_START=431 /DNA_END=1483 /DNA_ORIENTATION=+